MPKNNSIRNIFISVFFTLVFLYALFHIAGGNIFNRNKNVLESREGLLVEVEQERARQESEELDQILTDLDQTDLGTLPQ